MSRSDSLTGREAATWPSRAFVRPTAEAKERRGPIRVDAGGPYPEPIRRARLSAHSDDCRAAQRPADLQTNLRQASTRPRDEVEMDARAESGVGVDVPMSAS
jgi:hypothetical protein